MSRTFVFQRLQTDANSSAAGSLGSIGLKPENIYVAGIDTPEGEVFLTIRFSSTNPGFGAVTRNSFTIWAYDRAQDYLRIEKMLLRVREILDGVEAEKTDEGWITQIKWTGEGEDLADDIYRASLRTSSFAVVDSGR